MKTFRTILAILIAVTAANVFFIVVRPGGDWIQLLVSDALPVLCSIVSIAGLLSAFRAFKVWDEAKAAWALELAGAACFAIAETLYGVQELVLKIDAYPFWADLFWMAGYFPFIAGLVVFIHSYMKSGLSFGSWKRVLLPAAAAFLAAIAAIIAFLILPIAADGETSALAKAVYFYYPLGDLAMLAPAIVLIYLTSQFGKGAFSRPWKLIGIGLTFFVVSDIAYSILDWQGLYSGGGITDLGWNLAYLFIALGGASQRQLIASMGRGGTR